MLLPELFKTYEVDFTKVFLSFVTKAVVLFGIDTVLLHLTSRIYWPWLFLILITNFIFGPGLPLNFNTIQKEPSNVDNCDDSLNL